MKPPYTIAHTESSLGWGGQEIRVFSEMLAMQKRGHRLLLCAPPASAISQRSIEAGLTVHPFNDHKLAYPATIAKLASVFRTERVQVVNMHSSSDGWLAGIAARLAGTPLVIRSRHIEVDYPNRFLSRIAFRGLPHHVLTTSQTISNRLLAELNLHADRVTCVPTGIDPERFNPEVAGNLRQELKLPAGLPLVGMISVLRSWKGHPYFVEAAERILATGRDVCFIVAGDGSGRAKMERWVERPELKGRLIWLGHRDDVPNLLASLDVLVLPSTGHEGIPQIILQAQATAKAVVGTTVGGIPEVVSDGQTGLLVPPMDGAALAEKITLLLDQPELRRRLGGQARERVLRENTVDRMCERLEEIYARHLKDRG